jgi:branched-chain amino acid transport system permease protein
MEFMAFFLETLIGGLMAGMLYSLVALGFVLIFKASGVFNFAQGAMVLFAALAMARFAEWIPEVDWASTTHRGQPAGLRDRGAPHVRGGLADRALVLRHLVNQEGATLLMATLGITYFLEGLGQTLFGSDIYKIDVGMPKEPMFLLESCSRAACWSTRKT